MNINNVESYRDDIIHDLGELVSYPSIYSDDELPFGKNVKACLHKALEIAEGYGFTCVNVDDYCGYIEMGQGDEIIGILAHLDVVPVSDTWASDPFKLTFIDGKYYGRGTSDDKGAAVCSLTALRMLKPLEKTFTKRVRLILGCNEETGSRGIKYYREKYGDVSCGFTPDGSFPLIYGEKGMCGGLFSGKSEIISDINGGIVSNAVAAHCDVYLNKQPDSNLLKEYFDGVNASYTLNGNKLSVDGKAAHASTPDLGVNAISCAMESLYHAGLHDGLIDAYHNLISTTCHGEKLGIDFKDDYGDLSFCIGLASKKEDKIVFTIDIRCPVTFDPQLAVDTANAKGNGYIKLYKGCDPLFFSLESPMIKALMNAYQSITGNYETKPLVIGGGTYAKSMPNIVAFGCEEPDADCHIHDDNEYVTMESLLMQTSCYYQAILNLMKI